MLQFGEACGDLRHIFAEFSERMANERPIWAAYHALMSGRLIVIDKNTGVWPVGMG